MPYIGNVGDNDTVDTGQLKDGAVTAAKVAADVATQAELDLKAPLANPSFTGNVLVDIDDTVSLGNATYRFKDAYLSGGVYLGGTGAANFLDDYEVGTFTATIADATTGGNTGSTHAGFYTKVGKLVTVRVHMNNITTVGLTAANVLYARGLPFASSADSGNAAQGVVRPDNVNLQGARTFMTTSIGASDTWCWFSACGSAIADTAVDVGDITSGTSDLVVTLTYQAD